MASAHNAKKATFRLPLRAENETRTRDPDLGKVVLYQLSYFRINNPRFGEAGLQRYNKILNVQIFFSFFHIGLMSVKAKAVSLMSEHAIIGKDAGGRKK